MKKRLSPILIFAGTVNFLLFLVKFYVGVHTNSLCIYTDSINNLFDTISLILALVGISFINRAPTPRFKFGFGRVEQITTFIMALLMTTAGLGFGYSSLGRILTPVPVWYFTKYALIILGTCLVKLVLGIFFILKYKKEKSDVLKTVMLDSFLDCGITAVTLVSFTLSNTFGFVFDGFLGLLISIIIAIAGVKLIISSIAKLLGENEIEIEEKIGEILKKHPYTVKEITVHTYGKEKIYATIVLGITDTDAQKMQSAQNNIKASLEECGCSSTIEWEVIS